MALDYQIIDAFSSVPLQGNPVAVFFDALGIPEEKMQQIAMEMHLSEVTFLSSPDNDGSASVRIFTPVNELPFAGHPLIGTARAYFNRFNVSDVVLKTKIGPIKFFSYQGVSKTPEICMEQPYPQKDEFCKDSLIFDALGIRTTTSPITLYKNGPRHLVVSVQDRQELISINPNLLKLAQLSDMAINCIAVDNGVVINRMFSPAYGVNEDAGTGSAAGPIGHHCLDFGLIPHTEKITIEQGHALNKRCVMNCQIYNFRTKAAKIVVSGETAFVGAGFLSV